MPFSLGAWFHSLFTKSLKRTPAYGQLLSEHSVDYSRASSSTPVIPIHFHQSSSSSNGLSSNHSEKLEDSLSGYTEDANGYVEYYVVQSLQSKNVSGNAAQKLTEPIKELDGIDKLSKKNN